MHHDNLALSRGAGPIGLHTSRSEEHRCYNNADQILKCPLSIRTGVSSWFAPSDFFSNEVRHKCNGVDGAKDCLGAELYGEALVHCTY